MTMGGSEGGGMAALAESPILTGDELLFEIRAVRGTKISNCARARGEVE